MGEVEMEETEVTVEMAETVELLVMAASVV